MPSLDHYMKLGSWFAGTPQQLIEHLKKLEARYPGMEHINLCTSLCTPKAVMLEQFQRVAEEVMPAFRHSNGIGAASPPPRGRSMERHGFSSPTPAAGCTPTGELSPMAFLVGVRLAEYATDTHLDAPR